MCLCSKQFSLFSFYALPSGGKSKGWVIHLNQAVKLVYKSFHHISSSCGWLLEEANNKVLSYSSCVL